MSGTTPTVEVADLSASQRARRDRILEAATDLAVRGGYDAVQMRDVADRADVALGTLYRYFPSKVHLLVATLHRQSEVLRARLDGRPPDGGTAAERVLAVLRRATSALERQPRLAEAMFRALMFADTSAAREVDQADGVTRDLIIGAMAPTTDDPTAEQLAIARVIAQVWQSSLLTWLTGRTSSSDLHENLEVCVRLLLRDQPD